MLRSYLAQSLNPHCHCACTTCRVAGYESGTVISCGTFSQQVWQTTSLILTFYTGGENKVAQTAAFEVCGMTGLIRHGAPTQAAQISAPWQWSRVNEYCGMSAAQPMRRCGLTIAGLPLDSKARISGRTADLKDEVCIASS
jgi:hypothetical protein